MVYVFMAEGFEEIEAISPVDILRRADVDVKTVSITDNKTVKGAHGIEVVCDLSADEIDMSGVDMIVLPGGSLGTKNLDKSDAVDRAISYALEKELYITAICAAPTILAKRGLLKGLKATCYPALAGELIECGAKYRSDRVVSEKNFVTSEGAGTAGDFGFMLVEKICGKSKADSLRTAMVY